MRSLSAFTNAFSVILALEEPDPAVTLDDLRGALLLAAQAAETDAQRTREAIESGR